MQWLDSLASGKKGKAIPVIGCGGLYGCEKSRLPHFLDRQLRLSVLHANYPSPLGKVLISVTVSVIPMAIAN
jgi:hypothetical protein